MIRQAETTDLKQIQAIIDYGVSTGSVKPRPDLEQALDTFHVWEEDGKIVGCVCLNLYTEAFFSVKGGTFNVKDNPIKFGEVRTLVVLPEYQGKGIAKSFLNNIYEFCKSIGVYELFTTTDKSKLFDEMGFREEINGQKAMFLKIL